MKTIINAALAAALLATSAAPVLAQNYGDNARYQQNNSDYQQNRADYDRQVSDYNAKQAQYQRDRDAYDRRYGSGAYDRYYGSQATPVAPPAWNDNRDTRYSDNRSDPYARYANSPCEQAKSNAKSNRTGATVLGALVGAAAGGFAAGHHSTGTGVALGAVVGGAIGNQIGANSNDAKYAAQCDARGYYYSYEQTYPYQEDSSYRGRNGRYDSRYYASRRCRLAPAPMQNSNDYQYVRVCPDRDNRYRFTS